MGPSIYTCLYFQTATDENMFPIILEVIGIEVVIGQGAIQCYYTMCYLNEPGHLIRVEIGWMHYPICGG